MCSLCKSEQPCKCGCREHLAAIQEEFYPFEVVKVNCDECGHVLSERNA